MAKQKQVLYHCYEFFAKLILTVLLAKMRMCSHINALVRREEKESFISNFQIFSLRWYNSYVCVRETSLGASPNFLFTCTCFACITWYQLPISKHTIDTLLGLLVSFSVIEQKWNILRTVQIFNVINTSQFEIKRN